MEKLSSYKDQRHLSAAHGYAELAMYEDAVAELESIDPDFHALPEVLAVRIDISRGLEQWASMQEIARRLAEQEPGNPQWSISWAYATRRAESLEPARAILLGAVARHPKEAIFHYNLACYECQLGNLDIAKDYLKATFKLDPNYRLLSLKDEDLRPLWPLIREEE